MRIRAASTSHHNELLTVRASHNHMATMITEMAITTIDTIDNNREQYSQHEH